VVASKIMLIAEIKSPPPRRSLGVRHLHKAVASGKSRPQRETSIRSHDVRAGPERDAAGVARRLYDEDRSRWPGAATIRCVPGRSLCRGSAPRRLRVATMRDVAPPLSVTPIQTDRQAAKTPQEP